ncbi:sialin-like [Ostrea edulis]|uniref:sialin-like n=1 Tax=Ostrea edulis TaxID=37623 RepID=UPI0024AF4152|nr:sialin-like [Ostrea edulis]
MKEQKSKDSEGEDDVPCCLSQRWKTAYVGFFGFILVYAVRVNLSVAIVCMVKSQNSIANSTTLNNSNISAVGLCTLDEESSVNEHAEFDWSKTTQSTILASFFYGYIVTQIPAGWLSDRFGGRRVFGIGMFIASICTLLFPVCARTSIVLVYVLRILLGVSTAVSFPSVQSLWGRWAPPLERSKLISFTYLGTMFGMVLTLSSSGFLCQYGFDNGWGSIFYISGGLTMLWVFVWFYVTADTPDLHPRISEAERKYINSSIEYNTNVRTLKTPWKSIAMSSAVWACLTAHACNNWTNYTLLTSLPTFMKEVLKFNIKKNGTLSAVPYICQAVSGFIAGQTADILRSKGVLNTTHTRKLYQNLAFIGAGVMSVAVGYITCEQRDVAVALLSVAVMFTGLCRAGYTVNHVDFAPKYAGVLYGITNTVATVPGMVAPIVAGALTPNKSQSEWRYVFFVCAGFDLFGAIVFGLFASGTIQDWARDEVEIEVKISKTEENQLDKNFTLLPTNKDKEDTSSQNEGKATDREESTEITSAENEASAYSSVIKRRDDSDQHSGDHKEVTIVQY